MFIIMSVTYFNTPAKSPYLLFEQMFEHLLWARYRTERNRQKSLPLWSLHSFLYKYVNKNLFPRSDQLVFSQKGHIPKAATISPSEAIPII